MFPDLSTPYIYPFSRLTVFHHAAYALSFADVAIFIRLLFGVLNIRCKSGVAYLPKCHCKPNLRS